LNSIQQTIEISYQTTLCQKGKQIESWEMRSDYANYLDGRIVCGMRGANLFLKRNVM